MEFIKTIQQKLEQWDARYSDGKKSKCWRYNIADVFDPIDD